MTAWVMVWISLGSVPPFVSHSTIQRAPASMGGVDGLQGVIGVGLVAVEEMFRVEMGFAVFGLCNG